VAQDISVLIFGIQKIAGAYIVRFEIHAVVSVFRATALD
jgi:hypothetical protein